MQDPSQVTPLNSSRTDRVKTITLKCQTSQSIWKEQTSHTCLVAKWSEMSSAGKGTLLTQEKAEHASAAVTNDSKVLPLGRKNVCTCVHTCVCPCTCMHPRVCVHARRVVEGSKKHLSLFLQLTTGKTVIS